MNRQEVFNNFVQATHGKGRCVNVNSEGTTTGCMYSQPDHPGCAIGCQPGLKDKFNLDRWDNGASGFCDLCEEEEGLRDFFDIDDDVDDIGFMLEMQDFHDNKNHWDDGSLRLSALRNFCNTYELEVPEID